MNRPPALDAANQAPVSHLCLYERPDFASMLYELSIWCDGACRNNGRRDRKPTGGYGIYTPGHPDKTQREQYGALRNWFSFSPPITNQCERFPCCLSCHSSARLRSLRLYSQDSVNCVHLAEHSRSGTSTCSKMPSSQRLQRPWTSL